MIDQMRLDECCISISDGDHLPPPKSDCGVPFITISNIDPVNNSIDFSDTMTVPKKYYDSLLGIRKALVGDILYSVVGSFGIPVLIKENKEFVFQRHIAILRPNSKIVRPAYLYYIMKSKSFYAQADSYAIGSAQRTISLSSLRRMKVSIPSTDVQDQVIAALTAYDNLIEVNNKRISVLEEMAENLYKEWFVRFRFPGHESVPFENGLPKGWKLENLFDVAKITYGYSFSSELFCDDASLNAVVRIRDIPNNETKTYTEETCDEKYLIAKNAILVGMDGIFHMCLWNGKRAYLNQRVVSIESLDNKMSNYYGKIVLRDEDACEREARYMLDYLSESMLIHYTDGPSEDDAFEVTIAPAGYSRIDELLKNTSNGRNVLVAMKFGDDTNPLREAIRQGIKDAEYHAIFIDEVQHNDFITPELLKYIRDSKFVVVDLSHQNNGAYFEEGYAMGLGKPVIQLCNKDTKLHFDIAQKNTIIWETEDDIPIRLTNRIKATID